MGKDVYAKVAKIILKDIIDKKFHEFRGEGDPVRNVVFYDTDELILRHMCACADRLVGFDKDYFELKGVGFKRIVGKNYRGRLGEYVVNVRDMVPFAEMELEREKRRTTSFLEVV